MMELPSRVEKKTLKATTASSVALLHLANYSGNKVPGGPLVTDSSYVSRIETLKDNETIHFISLHPFTLSPAAIVYY